MSEKEEEEEMDREYMAYVFCKLFPCELVPLDEDKLDRLEKELKEVLK